MEIQGVGIHLKSICEVPARPYLVTDARGPTAAVAWPAPAIDDVSDVDDFQFAIDNCRPGPTLISGEVLRSGSRVIAAASASASGGASVTGGGRTSTLP